ncbi:MAG: ribonuclease E/G [Pseudomonadota bacterium]
MVVGPGRAALLVDGLLEDLLIDPAPGDQVPPLEEVFAARVERVAGKLGGAFVALAPGLNGFLRGARGVREGAVLPVQVTGFAEPGKAVPVTDRLLFKERTVILTPGAAGVNLSRALRDDARPRLEAEVPALAAALPEGAGLILRTAAAEAAAAALHADLAAAAARHARTLATETGAAGVAPGAAARARRDWEGTLEDAPDAWEALGLPDLIDALARPEAPLDAGAWLTVEATRALIAVDVNTGPDLSPAAALKANIAAMREIPRQLRLRGLGGAVTVDLAPLAKRDRKQIETVLKAALRRDLVETTVAGWTPLGHLELTRRRERRPLGELT